MRFDVLASTSLRRITCAALFLVGSWSPSVASADQVTFKPGSYVIDMGQPTQAIGNALKPYGLVYDLVTNYKVPVNWAINPAKTTFRLDAGDAIAVDFTATITTGPKNYGGGSFIIDAAFLTQPVIDAINTWKAQGVVVDTLAAALTTEIFGQVTRFPRAVLNAQNGDLAVAYFVNAGVPGTAYHVGLPTDCDDVFILTPADLDDWLADDQQTLYNFVNNGGGLWAAGHSVSALENLTVGATQLNFLSNGLLPFDGHSTGTPPYSYNAAAANDPIMQIMNRLDAATQNGVEQIYVPNSLHWRSTTTVAVFDPDHPDNPVSGTSPFNDAAAIAYGFAHGDPSKGFVMYEGGDSLAGNTAANIAAQRAFFNFLLSEGIRKTPRPAVSFPTILPGQSATLVTTISGGSGSYGYQWVSSNGGVFSVSTGTWNVGDPPIITDYTMTSARDTVRLLVTDTCGRLGFYSTNLGDTRIVSIANVNDAAEPSTDGKFRLTLWGGPGLTATNISYSVSGTASAGSDYAALTGTVLIPAGAAAADIDIDVLDGGTVEAAETVVIQLTGSDNADVSIDSLNDTATVQISDNDDESVAAIDVKPGSSSNTLNLNEHSVIPVALLGTDSFDVTQVDLNTLQFAGASVFKSARQDVNGDGTLDLLLHFRTQDTNLRSIYKELLAAADTTINGILDPAVSTHQQFRATLTGQMLHGESFVGSDTVDLFLAGRELRELVQELAADGSI